MAKTDKNEEEQPKGDKQPIPLHNMNMIFGVGRAKSKPIPPAKSDGGKVWRLKHTETEILAILERSNIQSIRLTPLGSNYTFLAALCDPETSHEYAAIYKPMRGEAPLWDFPNGTLYRRERAAYVVSRALNWNFIPPTIIREGPHGVGSMQLFVDSDESSNLYEFRDAHESEIKRITVFDLITNNADRKVGHFLMGMDGYVWGIDHGLCFNTVPKLRTVIWEYGGTPLPEDVTTDLLELATDSTRLKTLFEELEELLDHREVEVFFKRLESMVDNPVFPGINSRRQIPWGFF
jgi:uncharacterized repeat protein (TIGR03843 family)